MGVQFMNLDKWLLAKLAKNIGTIFKVYQLNKINILWSNKRVQKDMPLTSIAELSYITKDLSNKFYVGIDNSKVRNALAEYYGGSGVGMNLGGVRCGNMLGYQVKGIGNNGLSSEKSTFKHSNGSLSLLDAVSEAIYSEIINLISPVGANWVYGIVSTGENSAYCDYSGKGINKLTKGALLMREASFRPAHLMRNHSLMQESLKQFSIKDFERIKLLTGDLVKLIGQNNIDLMMKNCVASIAKQFSFTRAVRLCHGSMSPSNISITGRWIDVGASSFISDCNNYISSNNQVSFLDEPKEALNYIIECENIINKNENRKPNPQSIERFFWSEFNKYFAHSIVWTMGFDVNHHSNLTWDQLSVAREADKFINKYGQASRSDDYKFDKYFINIILPEYMKYISSRKSFLTEIVKEKQKNEVASEKYTIVNGFLRALKRNILPSVIAKSTLSPYISSEIYTSEEIGERIEEIFSFFKDIANGFNTETINIIKTDKVDILFNATHYTFSVKEAHNTIHAETKIHEYLQREKIEIFGVDITKRIICMTKLIQDFCLRIQSFDERA